MNSEHAASLKKDAINYNCYNDIFLIAIGKFFYLILINTRNTLKMSDDKRFWEDIKKELIDWLALLLHITNRQKVFFNIIRWKTSLLPNRRLEKSNKTLDKTISNFLKF